MEDLVECALIVEEKSLNETGDGNRRELKRATELNAVTGHCWQMLGGSPEFGEWVSYAVLVSLAEQ
jgi:hypothetical protein